MLFGVTSNDVLFSLSADEVSQNVGNRMARLAEHILEQQSFSPMFPAPAGMHPQADFRHMQHWTMKTSPDVLLIPSKLSTLAKEVRGTLVVNPGQLVKGSSGGTYAMLTIHPLPEPVLKAGMGVPAEEQQPMLHSVHSRTRVEILKI
jgi:DNA polymerase alpha subunit B